MAAAFGSVAGGWGLQGYGLLRGHNWCALLAFTARRKMGITQLKSLLVEAVTQTAK